MLDWEPPEIEEPSEDDSGGVSAPDEADVHVLDRDRPAGVGLLKNEFSRTIKMQSSANATIPFKSYTYKSLRNLRLVQ